MPDTQPNAPATKKAKTASKELGQTGTMIFEGQIYNPDYNPTLSGKKALQTYEEMRKSDGTVKALLRAVKLPILSSKLRIDPASDSAEDKATAEWTEAQLTGMSRTFPDTLRENLTFLDFGHSVFEQVYRINPDGSIGLKKLASRLQTTIYKWTTEDGQNGITQQLTNGELVSIPIEKLVIFTNEKEGDNWTGESILRPVFKSYHMKEVLEKIDAMAHERQGLGIPYVKSMSNATEEERKRRLNRVKAIRANEEDGLYIGPGEEYGFLDMMARTTRDPMASIRYHQFQMMISFLASFLLLGSTDSGSRALSQDLSEFFEMAVKYVANEVAATYQEYVIKRLIDLNFTVTEYPKLSFDGIGSFDYAAITDSLVKMAQAKTYTPRLEVENSILKAMGLPEAPEDAYYPDVTQPPPTPVVDPNQLEEEDQTKPNNQPKNKKGLSRDAFLRHYTTQMSQAMKLAVKEAREA